MTHNKLWQSAQSAQLDPLIEAYTVDDDLAIDQKLLGFDIKATKAHVRMLSKIGIVTTVENSKIASALDELYVKWQAGTFKLTDEFEDGHSAIEQYVTERCGAAGKKIHTGRSRNDQALVMLRLYEKDQLVLVQTALKMVDKSFGKTIKRAGAQKMPGYTHTQKAMPTTVAMWLESYQTAFVDQLALLKATLALIDQNPLGSAAGFGSDLALDREMTTHELGFARVQENPMYCGLSRGAFETVVVQALGPLMLYAGKFAEDMIQFTMSETGFFALPPSMTTGSSIMPHKQNYDVFEIMRAKARAFPSHISVMYAISSGVGSGYHRDLQLTKKPLIEACEAVLVTMHILAHTVEHLVINHEALDAAMTGELESVAKIDTLIAQGVPFREAYQRVKKSLS